MKKLIMLKIGGGVITDKNVQYGLREKVLSRLVGEIARGYKGLGDTKLIIGNGAGSFAHYSAHKYKTMEGFVNSESKIGMGIVRYDAVKLNQIVYEQLLSAEIPVFSFSPSSFMRVKNAKMEEITTGAIEDAMSMGMTPLVYGDVMVDQAKGCVVFSTERVFDELAKALKNKYVIEVIHVSAEEGVYDRGMKNIFREINADNFEDVKEHLGGSNGVDVSGGMLHKVEECLRLADWGVKSMIISGMVKGRVGDSLLGKEVVGTKIC